MYAEVKIPGGTIVRHVDDSFGIGFPDTYSRVLANSKDEFVEALNALGFEVVDDLPEVTDHDPGLDRVKIDGDWYYFNGVETPEDTRRYALRMLAAARWLEANPPVDEADVKALADLLGDRETARRLLASGKVTVNR